MFENREDDAVAAPSALSKGRKAPHAAMPPRTYRKIRRPPFGAQHGAQ
jgi:hypothetical protein